MQRATIKPKNGNFIDSDRTFFCSELIAKAYKVLGVIDSEDVKPCSSYYPSTFSSKGEVKLSEQAALGNEMIISVDVKKEEEENDERRKTAWTNFL